MNRHFAYHNARISVLNNLYNVRGAALQMALRPPCPINSASRMSYTQAITHEIPFRRLSKPFTKTAIPRCRPSFVRVCKAVVQYIDLTTSIFQKSYAHSCKHTRAAVMFLYTHTPTNKHIIKKNLASSAVFTYFLTWIKIYHFVLLYLNPSLNL